MLPVLMEKISDMLLPREDQPETRIGSQSQPHLEFVDMSVSLTRSPTSQAMMVDDLKLLYLPIAKNACSSLKRMVATLGGLELRKGEDIHIKLDTETTGLQFADRSEPEIRRALSSPDWMRFVVIREPLDRLVSAYIEKFVLHRNHPRIEETVGPTYRAVFGKDDLAPEDFARGVTFREFVEAILGEHPKALDFHWQPQSEQIHHIGFTHVYDVKRLDLLIEDLRAHVGQEIDLPRMNVSRDNSVEPVLLKGACDLLPADLPKPNRISVDSFLPEDLRMMVAQYYAVDVTLHKMVERINGLRALDRTSIEKA